MPTLWSRKIEMSAETETSCGGRPSARTSNRYTREFSLWSKPRYRICTNPPFRAIEDRLNLWSLDLPPGPCRSVFGYFYIAI